MSRFTGSPVPSRTPEELGNGTVSDTSYLLGSEGGVLKKIPTGSASIYTNAIQQFKTVALLQSDEVLDYDSVAPGDIIEAGGFRYQVVESDAVDQHLTTAGGVKVYRVDDETDATAIGATDAADPSGREVFAPALVTSMQDRKLNGVSIRDLLGRSYTDSNDGAAALSGFFEELAPAGIAVTDDRNLSVLCEEPLVLQDNLHLKLGYATTFSRGFTGAGETAALLAHSDWSVDVDGVVIEGGLFTTVNSSQTGRILALYGNDWQIRNARFTEFYGGQALLFGGDNIRMDNVRATTTSTTAGTGAFRMLGGRGFRGTGLYAEAGDDLFQFVPSAASANARFDQSIEDSYYIGCTGVSTAARVLVAAIAATVEDDDMTCTIRRCGWIACGGRGTERSVVIENTDGDGTVPRQIDDIVIDQCYIDGQDEDTAQVQSVLINGDFDKAIGKVTIRSGSVFNTPREHGVDLQSPGAELVLEDAHIEGEGAAVNVQSDDNIVRINGGRFLTVDNGGTATANWVVDVASAAANCEVILTGHPVFEEIASSKAAVRLGSSTAICRVYGPITANKASGATSTIGISHASGARVKLAEVEGDVDSVQSGAGLVSIFDLWRVSATNLADATHAINTTEKRLGQKVQEFTNHIVYTSRGSGATDIWDACDGSGTVTPS